MTEDKIADIVLVNLCNKLLAENKNLQERVNTLNLVVALLQHKPKRGRKPKLKTQADTSSFPRKSGRPPKLNEETKKIFPALVGKIKELNGCKTDKEAIMKMLMDSGLYNSSWRAASEARNLVIQLSKARRKEKELID